MVHNVSGILCCFLQEGLVRIAQLNGALDCITQAIIGSYVKSRVMGIQILTLMCDLDGGYPLVIDSVSKIRQRYAEDVRFKFIVNMLISDTTVYMPFVVSFKIDNL